jgi:hypothetical protein
MKPSQSVETTNLKTVSPAFAGETERRLALLDGGNDGWRRTALA